MTLSSQATPLHVLKLRQNDLEIELISDDAYFVSNQLGKWFTQLAKSSDMPLPSTPVMPYPGLPPVVSPAKLSVTEPPPARPEPPPARPEPPLPEPTATITELSHPPASGILGSNMEPSSGLVATVQNDFETVMNALLEDLDEPSPVTEADTPAAAPALVQDLAGLIDRMSQRGAGSINDFLLATAYYLTYLEGLERFTLKQINASMITAGLTPANHSALEQAIGKEHLSLSPDLTGTAEANEYQLTDTGRLAMEALLGF